MLMHSLHSIGTDHPGALFFTAIVVGFSFLWILFSNSNQSNSNFKLTEYDRIKEIKNRPPAPTAEEEVRQAQVLLEGFKFDANANEILGVSINASKKEILKAYKLKMKQYHPDKVARPGTDQWNDAQEIAKKITESKDYLISQLKS